MQYDNLQQALEQCKKYAGEGRQLATEAVEKLKSSVDNVLRQLEAQINDIKSCDFVDDAPEQMLNEQYKSFKSEAENITQKQLNDQIESLCDEFSITLFGRTMAGKSTLM